MNNIIENDIAVDLSNISKSFNSIKAINKATLQIKSGSIFGFLGPNGSGKSTLLRLICGLLTPDSGTGTCLGFDLLTERAQIQQRLGYMPQKFSLYQNLSVYENLDFISRIYCLRDRRTKINNIVEIFSLQDRLHQLTRTLSGGWRQRLSLATAILREPKILLLDEPTVGIDPHSRIIIWSLIQELARSGVTVLMSTHYMDEAERCNGLAYLSGGRILTHGTVDEVIDSAHISTWRITGRDLPGLFSTLKKNHQSMQIIEKGNEIRISSPDAIFIKYLSAELTADYSINVTETNLEDVFIYKMLNEDNPA